jgi:hypothetical protein
MKTRLIVAMVFLSGFSTLYAAEPTDQWKEVKESFYDLVQLGYRLIAVEFQQTKDGAEEVYLLQKDNRVYHCYEGRFSYSTQPFTKYTANCSVLVQPYNKHDS